MNPLKVLYALLRILLERVRLEYRRVERQTYTWRFFGNFLANKRGETGIGAGIVGTIVGIMISLLIAIIVVQNLISSQTPDATWSTEANATWATLQANIWVALTLLVIVPIIVGAIIILSYVRRGM